MVWFLDAMAQHGQREATTDGLKAWVRTYFEDYSEATRVEANMVAAWQLLLDSHLSPYIEGEVIEVIESVQEEITSETGRVFETYEDEQ